MPKRITREMVLIAFKALPEGAQTTTFRLAQRLGCSEYQVRAAVSWLVLGGQVAEVGATRRADTHGRKYSAKLYQFTGKDEIHRVPRDPYDRRAAQEERDRVRLNNLLLAWR